MRRAAAILTFAVIALTTSTASAYVAKPHVERPVGVNLGVSCHQIDGGEVIPFVAGQVVWELFPQIALTGDASFFTSGDRHFGPRLVTRAGGRLYPLEGRFAPFVGVGASYYHQWDVDYPYSDSSQQAGSAAAVGVSVGHELVTNGGFSWTVEVSLVEFFHLDGSAPSGPGWHGSLLFGYRF